MPLTKVGGSSPSPRADIESGLGAKALNHGACPFMLAYGGQAADLSGSPWTIEASISARPRHQWPRSSTGRAACFKALVAGSNPAGAPRETCGKDSGQVKKILDKFHFLAYEDEKCKKGENEGIWKSPVFMDSKNRYCLNERGYQLVEREIDRRRQQQLNERLIQGYWWRMLTSTAVGAALTFFGAVIARILFN